MVRHAYALLRSILMTAHEDGHLTSAPGRVRGAGATSPKREAALPLITTTATKGTTAHDRTREGRSTAPRTRRPAAA